MSGGSAKILAQAVPCLLNAFPGWRQPTHCRLYATGNGTSVPTVVGSKTTPGLTLARDGVGDLTVSLPKCRDVSDLNPQVLCTDPDTAGTNLGATVDGDPALTAATSGTIRLLVSGKDDGAAEDLETGDILDFTFWADFG